MEASMTTAKLFQTGRSQAVRLPKEFRFEGKEVYIKRVGNGVLLLPMEAKQRLKFWQEWYNNLAELDEPIERNQPTHFDERDWGELK
jgi:antitoxin VapB